MCGMCGSGGHRETNQRVRPPLRTPIGRLRLMACPAQRLREARCRFYARVHSARAPDSNFVSSRPQNCGVELSLVVILGCFDIYVMSTFAWYVSFGDFS